MRRLLLVMGALALGYALLVLTADFWATWLWFDSLGVARLLWLRTGAPLVLGLGAAAVAGLVAAANLVLAVRHAGPRDRYRGQLPPLPPAQLRLLLTGATLAIAVLLGLTAAPRWEALLLALHAPDFGVDDPLFGLDAGFYVFWLPLLNAARGWLVELLVIVGAAVVAVTVLQTGSSLRQGQVRLPRSLWTHLAVLGIGLLLTFAAGAWLDTYALVYARRGAVVGAGHADVTATLPALRVLTGITLAAAVGLAIFLLTRRWLVLAISVAAWPVAALLLVQLYPSVVQNLVVRPNELTLETPYLASNIRMTRLAFGLETIEDRPLTGRAMLTADDVRASSNTIGNLRLWDVAPLLAAYGQTQELRLYYSFVDVDVDRYRIDGRQRQVMLAARELDQDQLATQAQTWQNRHLVYTHGFGAVASPVNEQTREGLPAYFLQNVPPVGVPELTLAQPRIYFGEQTDAYIFVRTVPPRPGEGPEFDFPQGDANATYTYTGADGVLLDSPLKRLLLATAFGDPNIIFSRTFTDETRALYHRNVQDRIRQLAPFLKLDRDPYLTIVGGRLIWLQDAYVTTDRFPYATPAIGELGRVNYVRNPVKFAVDAYDGAVTGYVVDEAEPILRAYRALYPELFRPLAEAPAGLVAHFRYPEDLFNVQSQVFATYHMQDPQLFYNREDAWAVPALDGTRQSPQPMAAYYVVMDLTDAAGADPEFMLIRPFTPQGKGNMVAWLAGRSDGAAYGTLRLYTFPKDRLLFGPQQIDARINQDPEISAQLSLWNQRGSQVVRGNLLVVPVRDTLLYVQPLYLQAESSRLPELTRVIVASSERVAMAPDLATALARLTQVAPSSAPAPSGTAPPATGPPAAAPDAAEASRLAQQAREQFRQAQAALQRGDWAGYGAALKELEATLDRLADAP
ncbi:MAG: UPF0182 family protein [Chloroflexi bacterium]|nr:UPF0182 family protein [Chloroflexota bacterium]